MTRRNIVGGPGKFDLMLGLFESKILWFKLDKEELVPEWVYPEIFEGSFTVMVTSLEKKDESTEEWDIKGYIMYGKDSGERFYARYRLKGCSGWMELLD